jgi:hypothetical protein
MAETRACREFFGRLRPIADPARIGIAYTPSGRRDLAFLFHAATVPPNAADVGCSVSSNPQQTNEGHLDR